MKIVEKIQTIIALSERETGSLYDILDNCCYEFLSSGQIALIENIKLKLEQLADEKEMTKKMFDK